MGYRYTSSNGFFLTPKLRLDHHRVALGHTLSRTEYGKTTFRDLNKTGIYYGVRASQDWNTRGSRLRVWAEPGITHTIEANAKYSNISAAANWPS
ncbi:MAG: autotransporter domain-containing protein [Burkholderiaceae bacterium]|nr:autotransporter domain-containing protein [Burkholderiaceae bacterium]